jgi:hypothetical protein
MGQTYTHKNWQPEVKPANAAQPNRTNVFELDKYVPPKPEWQRPGSADAFKIESRGYA